MPKDYNTFPYYDDYDESKNFVSLLFRPGRAIQSRELTQLQTILNNQTSKFANHLFEDGSKILGAKIELDQSIISLEITDTTTGTTPSPSDYIGYYIKGYDTINSNDTGAAGKVIGANDATNTIFVKSRGGTFTDGYVNGLPTTSNGIAVTDIDNVGNVPNYISAVNQDGVGTVVSATLAEGVVYIDGYFAKSVETTLFIDEDLVVDDTNDISLQLGFTLVQGEVTSDMDSSLLDPANGFYNVNAPGADRSTTYVVLSSYDPLLLPTDGSFFAKMFITKYTGDEEYSILKEEADTQYADILDLLARRTYETNGDYTTNPFIGTFEDHPTDDTKFNFILDPGVAYVKGYRHETTTETKLDIDKSREYLSNVESVWVDQSPYIKLEREAMTFFPQISTLDKLEFYATDASNAGTWNEVTGVWDAPVWTTADIIGTARAIGLVFTGTEYRLYITDHQSILGDVASVSAVKSSVGDFVSNTILENADDFNPAHTVLYSSTSNRINAYPFQRTVIKSNDVTSFIHRVQKVVQVQPSNSIAVVGTLASEEIDLSQSPIVADLTVGKIFIPNVDYTVVSTTTDITITFTNTQLAPVGVHYYVEVTGGSRKSKVLNTFTENVEFANFVDGKMELSFEDGIEVTEILAYDGAVGDFTNPIVIDVSTVTFDNGSRDYYYDICRIENVPTHVHYDVTYSYYSHGGSGNFFDINSYIDSGNTQESIPSYESPTDGGTVFLADVIDFRRKLSDVSGGVAIPTPRTYMIANYDYYLGRRDLIEIDQEGVIAVKKGVASLEPAAPEVSPQSMGLYVLDVSPYTYSIGSVTAAFMENKNYTMRDIGELEQRIDNLEYYSSLNLLEKSAEDLEVTDEFGNNKFKNGILVDNFYGGNVVDTQDAEYFCAFDPEQGQMRPVFSQNDVDLGRDTRASKHDNLVQNVGTDTADTITFSDPVNNVRFHTNSVTLEYTAVNWVAQNQASQYMNVNPYNVFSWNGNLTLVPDTDYWMDTQWIPDIIMNADGIYDNLKGWNKYILQSNKQIKDYGTKWGSWRVNWTGVSKSSSSSRIIDRSRNHRTEKQVRDVTTRTTTTTRSLSRKGTRLVATPNRVLEYRSTKVVDVSVIPYMRSIPIQFEAKNLKPNTELHAFFNDVNVNAHITPDTGFEPVGAYAVKTDGAGKVKGVFTVPSTEALKFRTGLRPFSLVDDTFHPNTSADAEFLSAGHIQKKQRTMRSISKPIVSTIGVGQNRVTRSSSKSTTSGKWFDPVAESFEVDQVGGLYITDIEVFFKTKDAVLPVSIMIVETENGYPSQRQLPFAQVSLDPADVNLSDDSSVGTTFQFTDPIYVEGGSEYAFIVYSNSDSYNIWYGGIGEFDVQQLPNEVRIAKQPYAGVFFKSQNGSTWTADQNLDLKFNINRASFVTEFDAIPKTGSIYLVDNLDLIDGDLNDQPVDIWATNAQFEVDHLLFDKTVFKYSYQFSDDSLLIETANSEDLSFTTQKHISNSLDPDIATAPKRLGVEVFLKTESEFVSPMMSINRSHCILVNNVLYDWDEIVYENHSKINVDTPIPDANGYYNAGAYVSRITKLQNPSDDLKIVMDVLKQGAADIDLYFSTGKFSPKYVDIYDTNIVEGRSDMKGKKLYLYNQINDGTLTQATTMSCTGVDTDYTPNRVYITGVGDPSQFLYNTDWAGTADLRQFVTTENIPDGIVLDWNILTSYIVGDYVFSTSYIWKALEVSTGVEPTDYGTAWERISYNEVCEDTPAAWLIGTTYAINDRVVDTGFVWTAIQSSTGVQPSVNASQWRQDTPVEVNNIKTDIERKWRPMIIESQNNDEGVALTDFVEYTWIPKDTVEEEFSTFSIKIQMKAKHPSYVPLCSALRGIATY